jgi:hypothetical protein
MSTPFAAFSCRRLIECWIITNRKSRFRYNSGRSSSEREIP